MAKLDIIILCGGLGNRIKSKSKNLPKILIEIEKKKPFILYLLKLINLKNFNKIVLSIGYRKNKLIKFIKQNPKLNLNYSIEYQLLGTGGAIKNTLKKNKISNPFFVVNGDTFFNFKVSEILRKRKKNKKKPIILLKKDEKGKRYDQFKIENKKLILSTPTNKSNNLISTGFYLFYKENFKIKKKKFSIEKDIIPNLVNKKKLDYKISKSRAFFDIGIPKDLMRFKNFFKKNENNN